MSLKIKSITIEGMHNVDKLTYDFDDSLTYLHGLNGKGKSTVLTAIQLALLGYIPGCNKNKESIFRHANSHTMAVTLELGNCSENDSGIIIRRVWTGTSKGINYAVDITPQNYTEDDIRSMISNVEIPLYNFNDFVGMTANKLKDWFISFMPDGCAEVDWQKLLTDSVIETPYYDEAFVKDVCAQIGPSKKGVEGVRDVNLLLKCMLSADKSALDRNAQTIRSLIYYEDSENENVEELRSQKAFLQQQAKMADLVRHQLTMKANHDEVIHDLQSKLPAHDPAHDDELSKWEDEMANLCKQQTHIQESISDKKLKLASIDYDISSKMSIINGDGICPYTRSRCESVSDLTFKYKQEVSELNSKKSELKDEINNLLAQAKANTTTIDTYRMQIDKRMSLYFELSTCTAQAVSVDDHTPELLTTDFDAQIREIDDKLIKIEANERYNALIESLTAEKYKFELEIAALKIWIKLTDANGIQSEMAEKPFENFAAEIDKYLKHTFGENVRAGFNVSGKANSFSFGIIRNDKYIPYELLSSGEKCLYTLSLMLVILKSNSSSNTLNTIMIDDLLDHLDDQNIERLFESLYTVDDIQFIFAGVKPCKFAESVNCVIEVGDVTDVSK